MDLAVSLVRSVRQEERSKRNKTNEVLSSHENEQKDTREKCYPSKQRRLTVDEVCGRRNNLNPKVRWNRGVDLQCTSRLHKVTMLTLGKPF